MNLKTFSLSFYKFQTFFEKKDLKIFDYMNYSKNRYSNYPKNPLKLHLSKKLLKKLLALARLL